MNVPLFAAEPTKGAVEAGPSVAPAREHAKALHRDVEGRCTGVGAARVECPYAVHTALPARFEVRRHRTQVVIEQRSLQQVAAPRRRLAIVDEAGQSTGGDEHVRIHAQHDVATHLLEHHIPDACAPPVAARDIAIAVDPVLELLQRFGTRSTGVVVDDDELDRAVKLGVMEPDRLHGEEHAVIVVVGRHSDRQAAHSRAAGRAGVGGPSKPGATLAATGTRREIARAVKPSQRAARSSALGGAARTWRVSTSRVPVSCSVSP